MSRTSSWLLTLLILLQVAWANGASQPRPLEPTTIAGRVTDSDGRPIAGAKLTVKESATADQPQYGQTQTDADGRFSISALPSYCQLSVYADGYAPMYREGLLGEGVNKAWNFALPRSARVRGRVVDTSGQPAPLRLLELAPVRDGAVSRPEVRFHASDIGSRETDANGEFELANVSPGKYSIMVSVPSGPPGDIYMLQRPVKGGVLEVKPGDRLEGFEIQINPPEAHAITGRVLDAAGKPVRGVYVMSSLPHGPSWWSRTDATGSFHLQGLDGMGRPSVPVRFQYLPGVTGQIAIPEVPVNSRDIELILPPKGAIHATVTRAGTGEVIKTYDIKVTAVILSGSGAVWEGPHGKLERRPDHSITISGVPAGRAAVEVRVEGLGLQRLTTKVEGDRSAALQITMPEPEQEKR